MLVIVAWQLCAPPGAAAEEIARDYENRVSAPPGISSNLGGPFHFKTFARLSQGIAVNTILLMLVELTRLMLGLLIAFFHRPIADFVLVQERALVITFRQRGVPLPAAPTTETARTIYFLMGILLALFELGRIWFLLHPASTVSWLTLR